MSIEMKALVSAIAAGLAVLGVTLGLAAVIHKAPQTTTAPPTNSTAVVDTQLVSKGQGFYAKSCASCHGKTAQGGYGPSLVGMHDSDAEIADVIKRGIPGKMPGFAKKYADPDVQAIVTYLRSIKS